MDDGRDLCANPMAMKGFRADDGRQVVAVLSCGDRREANCPRCSGLYAGDARAVISAGLAPDEASGWAGIDDPSVIVMFATWTAPGFGAVHFLDRHHNRRCRCGRRHRQMDTDVIGAPLNPSTYDYEGQVGWCLAAAKLRAASLRAIRRALPDFEVHYVTVVEPQKRLVPHFHQLLRLRALDHQPVPTGLHGRLAEAVRTAVLGIDGNGGVRVPLMIPGEDGTTVRRNFGFGHQADVRVLDGATVGRAIRYLTKYVTKDLRDAGDGRADAGGSPIERHRAELHDRARKLVGAMLLAKEDLRNVPAPRPEVDPAVHQRRLQGFYRRKVAETIAGNRGHRRTVQACGYRGMVMTKSRGWPLTFAACRARRRDHAGADRPAIEWDPMSLVRLLTLDGMRQHPSEAALHLARLTGDPAWLGLPAP